MGAGVLLLRAAGAGVRDDAVRSAEESRRPEGARRLLGHPEGRRAFRLGEATLGRVLAEILLSFAPTFAALAALLWAGYHAPALVGLVGERGWFRWGV